MYSFQTIRQSFLFRLTNIIILVCFLTTFIQIPNAKAQSVKLPAVGSMVNLSQAFTPLLMKGLKVHPENPLLFDFIMDTGDVETQHAASLQDESKRLIKYFLASLTVPEQDQWVNLSPYEKDRILPNSLSETQLGEDLLAQDYILKQLTASLIYPEKGLGQEFWQRIYKQAQDRFGTNEIPVNTFNKVWIVADKADVYVHQNTAYVVASHLKVMLEEDYLATTKNQGRQPGDMFQKEHQNVSSSTLPTINSKLKPNVQTQHAASLQEQSLTSQIIREILLPAIEQEVNQGQNFTQLRQMFHSMILATWYKNNLKTALLTQVYANQAKTEGVNPTDIQSKEKIYQQYLQAYKKGVFNFIKEEPASSTNSKTVPRKYFSGGVTNLSKAMVVGPNSAQVASFMRDPSKGDLLNVKTQMSQAMVTSPVYRNNSLGMDFKEIEDVIENEMYEDGRSVSPSIKARLLMYTSKGGKESFVVRLEDYNFTEAYRELLLDSDNVTTATARFNMMVTHFNHNFKKQETNKAKQSISTLINRFADFQDELNSQTNFELNVEIREFLRPKNENEKIESLIEKQRGKIINLLKSKIFVPINEAMELITLMYTADPEHEETRKKIYSLLEKINKLVNQAMASVSTKASLDVIQEAIKGIDGLERLFLKNDTLALAHIEKPNIDLNVLRKIDSTLKAKGIIIADQDLRDALGLIFIPSGAKSGWEHKNLHSEKLIRQYEELWNEAQTNKGQRQFLVSNKGNNISQKMMKFRDNVLLRYSEVLSEELSQKTIVQILTEYRNRLPMILKDTSRQELNTALGLEILDIREKNGQAESNLFNPVMVSDINFLIAEMVKIENSQSHSTWLLDIVSEINREQSFLESTIEKEWKSNWQQNRFGQLLNNKIRFESNKNYLSFLKKYRVVLAEQVYQHKRSFNSAKSLTDLAMRTATKIEAGSRINVHGIRGGSRDVFLTKVGDFDTQYLAVDSTFHKKDGRIIYDFKAPINERSVIHIGPLFIIQDGLRTEIIAVLENEQAHNPHDIIRLPPQALIRLADQYKTLTPDQGKSLRNLSLTDDILLASSYIEEQDNKGKGTREENLVLRVGTSKLVINLIELGQILETTQITDDMVIKDQAMLFNKDFFDQLKEFRIIQGEGQRKFNLFITKRYADKTSAQVTISDVNEVMSIPDDGVESNSDVYDLTIDSISNVRGHKGQAADIKIQLVKSGISIEGRQERLSALLSAIYAHPAFGYASRIIFSTPIKDELVMQMVNLILTEVKKEKNTSIDFKPFLNFITKDPDLVKSKKWIGENWQKIKHEHFISDEELTKYVTFPRAFYQSKFRDMEISFFNNEVILTGYKKANTAMKSDLKESNAPLVLSATQKQAIFTRRDIITSLLATYATSTFWFLFYAKSKQNDLKVPSKNHQADESHKDVLSKRAYEKNIHRYDFISAHQENAYEILTRTGVPKNQWQIFLDINKINLDINKINADEKTVLLSGVVLLPGVEKETYSMPFLGETKGQFFYFLFENPEDQRVVEYVDGKYDSNGRMRKRHTIKAFTTANEDLRIRKQLSDREEDIKRAMLREGRDIVNETNKAMNVSADMSMSATALKNKFIKTYVNGRTIQGSGIDQFYLQIRGKAGEQSSAIARIDNPNAQDFNPRNLEKADQFELNFIDKPDNTIRIAISSNQEISVRVGTMEKFGILLSAIYHHPDFPKNSEISVQTVALSNFIWKSADFMLKKESIRYRNNFDFDALRKVVNGGNILSILQFLNNNWEDFKTYFQITDEELTAHFPITKQLYDHNFRDIELFFDKDYVVTFTGKKITDEAMRSNSLELEKFYTIWEKLGFSRGDSLLTEEFKKKVSIMTLQSIEAISKIKSANEILDDPDFLLLLIKIAGNYPETLDNVFIQQIAEFLRKKHQLSDVRWEIIEENKSIDKHTDRDFISLFIELELKIEEVGLRKLIQVDDLKAMLKNEFADRFHLLRLLILGIENRAIEDRSSYNRFIKDHQIELKAEVKIDEQAKDPVMTHGGIDLNSANMRMNEQGETINITFDQAMIDRFKKGDFKGIVPTILNITPIPNILPILGLAPSKEETERIS